MQPTWFISVLFCPPVPLRISRFTKISQKSSMVYNVPREIWFELAALAFCLQNWVWLLLDLLYLFVADTPPANAGWQMGCHDFVCNFIYGVTKSVRGCSITRLVYFHHGEKKEGKESFFIKLFENSGLMERQQEVPSDAPSISFWQDRSSWFCWQDEKTDRVPVYEK